jgi:hypothetical protein
VGRCFTHLSAATRRPSWPPCSETSSRANAFDYAAARASVRLDTTRDAYAQTIDALRTILSAPDTLSGPAPWPPCGSWPIPSWAWTSSAP